MSSSIASRSIGILLPLVVGSPEYVYPCLGLLPQGAARSASTLGRSPTRTRTSYKPAEQVGGVPRAPPETAEVTRLSDTT